MRLYKGFDAWGHEKEEEHPGYRGFGKDDNKEDIDYHKGDKADYITRSQENKDQNVYTANKPNEDADKEKKESLFDRKVEEAEKEIKGREEQKFEKEPEKEEGFAFSKKTQDILGPMPDDTMHELRPADTEDNRKSGKGKDSLQKKEHKESIEEAIEKQKWLLQS